MKPRDYLWWIKATKHEIVGNVSEEEAMFPKKQCEKAQTLWIQKGHGIHFRFLMLLFTFFPLKTAWGLMSTKHCGHILISFSPIDCKLTCCVLPNTPQTVVYLKLTHYFKKSLIWNHVKMLTPEGKTTHFRYECINVPL